MRDKNEEKGIRAAGQKIGTKALSNHRKKDGNVGVHTSAYWSFAVDKKNRRPKVGEHQPGDRRPKPGRPELERKESLGYESGAIGRKTRYGAFELSSKNGSRNEMSRKGNIGGGWNTATTLLSSKAHSTSGRAEK